MGSEKTGYAGWSVLEVKGYRRLGGWVSETTLAGAGFLRIDIPKVNQDGSRDGDGWLVSQLYHPDAVFSLSACSEAEAFAEARNSQPRPLVAYQSLPLRDVVRDDERDDWVDPNNEDGETEPPF